MDLTSDDWSPRPLTGGEKGPTHIRRLFENGKVNRLALKAWSKVFHKKKGGTCLDHCCGETPIKKAVEFLGYEWVGFDHAGEIATVKGDAHDLPFDENTFDVVYSEQALEHLFNPLKAIEEINRVLKAGGFFVGSLAFLEPYRGHSYFHVTHRGLKFMLQKSGFEVVFMDTNSPSAMGVLLRYIFPLRPLRP